MIIDKSTAPRGVLALAILSLCLPRAASPQNGLDGAAKRAATALVRPGDRIEMRFLREPTLSGAVGVNERGDAAFPKLGVMHVADMTIARLEDTLRVRYAEYLRAPEVEFSVLRRVVVNGEVKEPDVYHLDINSTVRDAIAKAGGLTENGSTGRVSIVRDGRRISVKGWEREQSTRVDLLSGDQVLVGRKPWIVINFFPAVSTAVTVILLVNALRQ